MFWWERKAEERYWLESTDRDDIGTDLRAPLTDGGGDDNWRYGLFREAKVGDLVFHYDKRAGAITSVSRVAGEPVDAPIVWAARGSYARERGAVPVEVPGYRLPLSDHRPLNPAITLEALRARRAEIGALRDALVAETGGPLYFPFELADRPLRPLQGYAFKLPARFVEAFPSLRAAVDGQAQTMPARSEADLFHHAVAAIEAAASNYAIAGLQSLRARNRGLTRISRSIFGNRPLSDVWAFHSGGRQELQFNVGIDTFPDGTPAFRAGVAFSFETSRSLPNIEVLIDKVARFNAYLREHNEAFADLAMWHTKGDVRSTDYPPSPIPESLVEEGIFVFLGGRQPWPAVDPQAALRVFDQLLPLYTSVEDRSATPPAGILGGQNDEEAVVFEELLLGSGREIDGGRWIEATLHERKLNVFLRHREIQRQLKAKLLAEGYTDILFEASIGSRLIDLIARRNEELWFYEIKTAATVRGCLREAIGQLLEYALWPGATRPQHLVVVGEPSLDATARAYLTELNRTFPVPISYRQLVL
jgi:hypothetical protein